MKNIFKMTALASLLAAAIPAQATNGYFLPGFGVKSQGAGGVGIALQQDSLSQAANPANAVQTGKRWDLGLSLFNPERSATTGPDLPVGISPEGGFGFGRSSTSSNTMFLMPDFGFTMPLNDRLSVGFALVGNGGMNTTFRQNIMASPFFAFAPDGGLNQVTGVDLMQLIAPLTVAYKLTEQQSVGVSLNLAAQRFAAYGLGQFGLFGISSAPSRLTNNGHDYSYGAGIRLGWLGRFMDDRLSLGATWASRTYMSKFGLYRGLFAEQGDFDMPENYGLGLAIKATDKLTAAFDVVKILYSDVASVGNPGPGTATGSGVSQTEVVTLGFSPSTAPLKLGNNQGMGFGWTDQTVYKLGFIYDYSDDLTLRAGYNYGKSPVRNDQLVFSALAPGIVEKHYSIGFTKKFKGETNWELSGTYMNVATNSQSGCGQAVVDCVSYSMNQHILGVSFGVKY
jgi:long-chain fatty acid transport protein